MESTAVRPRDSPARGQGEQSRLKATPELVEPIRRRVLASQGRDNADQLARDRRCRAGGGGGVRGRRLVELRGQREGGLGENLAGGIQPPVVESGDETVG